MLKINLLFRHPDAGFSIPKTFSQFKDSSDSEVQINSFYMPEFRISFSNIKKNLQYIKSLPDADIYHITGDIHYGILALKGKNTVLTVHDTVSLDREKNFIKFLVLRLFWFLLPCLFAKKIVCISEFTKKRLLHYVPYLNKKKIEIIPNHVPEGFTFSEKEINKEKPVILHIGTTPNKNLEREIQAIDGIQCHLIIIGKIGQEIIDLMQKYNIDYENKLNLSDEEIIQEYKNCDIVAFPSYYEGFGMPIIEGQTIGRIVITSNISPMKEIAGEGAVIVDPYDISSIKSGFLKTCKEDCSGIIIKGIENSKKYSFESFRNSYINLYKGFTK